jgi:hypothetical protein
MVKTKKRNKLALFWSNLRDRLPCHGEPGSRPENFEKNSERPRDKPSTPDKPSIPMATDENLTCLLERIRHCHEVMKGVEESLTRILGIFVHDLESVKKKLKEFERN